MAETRVTQVVAEAIYQSTDGAARVTQVVPEAVYQGSSLARLTQVVPEAIFWEDTSMRGAVPSGEAAAPKVASAPASLVRCQLAAWRSMPPAG